MPLPGALGSARGSSGRGLSPTRRREMSCSRSSDRDMGQTQDDAGEVGRVQGAPGCWGGDMGTARAGVTRAGWAGAERLRSLETNQRRARGPPLDVLISSVSPEPFIKLQRKGTAISSHLPVTGAGKPLAHRPRTRVAASSWVPSWPLAGSRWCVRTR